jgi:Ca2+-binding RTX toxin-like protein
VPTAGAAAEDPIFGGRARERDTLDGGEGNDRIFGGKGVDDVDGGAGNDRIRGGKGADALDGGDGDDRIDARGDGRRADTITCGEGVDRVRADARDQFADREACEHVRVSSRRADRGARRGERERRGRARR